MDSNEIRVLLCDDHSLIRTGIKRILEFEDEMTVIAEGSNGIEGFEYAKILKPDVIVSDINMPEMTGIEMVKKLRAENVPSKVIMLTVNDDKAHLIEALDIGADGYLLKDSDPMELVSAIKEVLLGENYIDKRLVKLLISDFKQRSNPENDNKLNLLSNREIQILKGIAKGMTNKEIAEDLYISEKTVKNYATSVFRKIGVKDRVKATIYAINNHIEDF